MMRRGGGRRQPHSRGGFSSDFRDPFTDSFFSNDPFDQMFDMMSGFGNSGRGGSRARRNPFDIFREVFGGDFGDFHDPFSQRSSHNSMSSFSDMLGGSMGTSSHFSSFSSSSFGGSNGMQSTSSSTSSSMHIDDQGRRVTTTTKTSIDANGKKTISTEKKIDGQVVSSNQRIENSGSANQSRMLNNRFNENRLSSQLRRGNSHSSQRGSRLAAHLSRHFDDDFF